MKYNFKDFINTNNKSILKILIAEIKEIYSILSLIYTENNNINDALFNLGIIENDLYINDLKKIFDTNLDFSLDNFILLSNNLNCHNNKCSTCPVNKYCNKYRAFLSEQYEKNDYPTIIDLFCRSRWTFIRI